MKFLNLIAVVLGIMFLAPVAANASPDDFDGITVEAIELDNDSSDDVTHEVEIPHEEDREDHHGRDHDEHEKDDDHDDHDDRDDDHGEEQEDSHEDGHEEHAEGSSDESVS